MSYRTVGVGRTGQLISGTSDPKLGASIETFKKTAPSIPSKFGSKSKNRPSEKNGFGGRTHRFSSSQTTAQPGPGYYHKASTLTMDAKTNGSVSKRGYTSMISKSNRFTTTDLLDAADLPGPGSYSPMISTIPVADPNSAPQSMFAKPRRYRDEKAENIQLVPGPGQYEVNPKVNREKIIDMKTGSAAFKDNMKRFMRNQPQTDQAPGSYNVGSSSDFLLNYGRKDKLPDPSMSSKSERGSYLRQNPDVPGPGNYAPENAEKILKKAAGWEKKPSAWSAAPANVGKKGAEKNGDEPTPGPGWYQLGSSGMSGVYNEGGAGSSFKSGTRRFGKGLVSVKPPGPAYYDPKKPDRQRRFHLNVDKKWV
ncbi:hypothetical protein TL16_g07913 [Triparma laevis f. inornata]|uniref:Uncharacterized protein n=2 Tax=Triparma laevis TaxID=1534972 RepID=A0A9W7KXQ6_9STRA|nr:hypothetical protein TL16_g07913 [Triparma laevis f. inornata]GMI15692.1 hypothetical protein TrLO_g14050 [Triparma laevis f. longispina]